jgi:hypothetical protein
MGLHVAQMTSLDGMRQCFDAVTVNNARVLGWKATAWSPAAAPTSCCCRRARRSRRSACAPSAWVVRAAGLHALLLQWRWTCPAGRAAWTGRLPGRPSAAWHFTRLRALAKDLLR